MVWLAAVAGWSEVFATTMGGLTPTVPFKGIAQELFMPWGPAAAAHRLP
jgi:hypothetical protein